MMSIGFFSETSTREIYTLSLHDALPISGLPAIGRSAWPGRSAFRHDGGDRKSTRLNSSHVAISYAVFCLKKQTPPAARTSAQLVLPAGELQYTSHSQNARAGSELTFTAR